MSTLPPRDVRLLRRVLARELDTINEYEEMAEEAEEEVVRAFFRHLADEEKEHVAEAMALIHERDPAQAAESSKDIRADHFLSGGAAPPADAQQAPVEPAPRFTVGSLKGRRED
jgi:rubrerythrin